MIAGMDAFLFSIVVFAITCGAAVVSYYIGYDQGFKDGYMRRRRLDDIRRWQ